MPDDPSLFFWISITIVLLVWNAFFVASEFALVKVRLSQLEIEIKRGKRWAVRVKHILQHLNSYLSGIQLGVTISSLLLGWMGEPAIGWWVRLLVEGVIDLPEVVIHGISFGIALFFITLLHIVFGEQIPKLIAIYTPLRTAALVAFPLIIFQKIFFPFIWLFDSLTRSVMGLFHIQSHAHHELHSEEEIKLLLSESEEGGVIAESSNEIIQNVFEFDDRTVRQIYIPRSRIYALDVEEDVMKHLEHMVTEGYSRVPVYRRDIDNIAGVVYLKDLLPAMYRHEAIDIVKFIRPAHFVPQNQKIEQLLKDFQRLHIQMAIVTNEFGETAGIVTLEDIIEELVGEIQDEHDSEEAIVIEKRPGTYIVKTNATIDDVNDFLPFPLPESRDYETVSGFVNTVFDRIPSAWESHTFEVYEITILKWDQQAVDLIKLRVQE